MGWREALDRLGKEPSAGLPPETHRHSQMKRELEGTGDEGEDVRPAIHLDPTRHAHSPQMHLTCQRSQPSGRPPCVMFPSLFMLRGARSGTRYCLTSLSGGQIARTTVRCSELRWWRSVMWRDFLFRVVRRPFDELPF